VRQAQKGRSDLERCEKKWQIRKVKKGEVKKWESKGGEKKGGEGMQLQFSVRRRLSLCRFCPSKPPHSDVTCKSLFLNVPGSIQLELYDTGSTHAQSQPLGTSQPCATAARPHHQGEYARTSRSLRGARRSTRTEYLWRSRGGCERISRRNLMRRSSENGALNKAFDGLDEDFTELSASGNGTTA
jgi:hypothetical protein